MLMCRGIHLPCTGSCLCGKNNCQRVYKQLDDNDDSDDDDDIDDDDDNENNNEDNNNDNNYNVICK